MNFNLGGEEEPPCVYVPSDSRLQVSGGRVCAYCFAPRFNNNLKLCSGCKRVSYCSTTCQKRDWNVTGHKEACPLEQKRNKYDRDVVGDRAVDFNEVPQHQMMRTAIHHGKDPNSATIDHYVCGHVKFEVLCAVCFRTPFQKATYTKFLSCDSCKALFFCSEQCKSKISRCHSKSDCDTLKLLHATERVEIDYHLTERFPYNLQCLVLLSFGPRKRHRPLSTGTWDDYKRGFLQDYGSPFDGSHYDSLIAAIKTSVPRPLARQALALLRQEGRSIPFTIIQALEQCIPNIAKKTSLDIHIIGAAEREMRGKLATEEILHHFPALKKLDIRYIGPEASRALAKYEPTRNWACAHCKPRGTARYWTIYQMAYHTFCRTEMRTKPDLVVGLNTGMSEVETEAWGETRAVLANMRVPAVFTSYFWEEAMMERNLFKRAGFSFLVDVQRNKWRSVIPRIHFGCGRRDGLLGVYNSRYWYVVGGDTAVIIPKTPAYLKNLELD